MGDRALRGRLGRSCQVGDVEGGHRSSDGDNKQIRFERSLELAKVFAAGDLQSIIAWCCGL